MELCSSIPFGKQMAIDVDSEAIDDGAWVSTMNYVDWGAATTLRRVYVPANPCAKLIIISLIPKAPVATCVKHKIKGSCLWADFILSIEIKHDVNAIPGMRMTSTELSRHTFRRNMFPRNFVFSQIVKLVLFHWVFWSVWMCRPRERKEKRKRERNIMAHCRL